MNSDKIKLVGDDDNAEAEFKMRNYSTREKNRWPNSHMIDERCLLCNCSYVIQIINEFEDRLKTSQLELVVLGG